MLKKLLTFIKNPLGGPKFDPSRIDSIISEGMIVEGTVTYSGTLVINGTLKGTIVKAPGSKTPYGIIVGKTGVVDCEAGIEADFLINNGVISASINTQNLLKLEANSITSGTEIKYGELTIAKSAVTWGLFKSSKYVTALIDRNLVS